MGSFLEILFKHIFTKNYFSAITNTLFTKNYLRYESEKMLQKINKWPTKEFLSSLTYF